MWNSSVSGLDGEPTWWLRHKQPYSHRTKHGMTATCDTLSGPVLVFPIV